MRQILDAVLLSEQRANYFAERSGDDSKTKSQTAKIMTYEDLKNMERENIRAALAAANYRIYGANGAAELLGTKPTTLASRIKALDVPMRPQ